ncbi:MAG: hypothetical protein ACI9S8_001814 [Chlamydiales bacterium]|jgi:uncharacterized protein YheU (UPF0270 family)
MIIPLDRIDKKMLKSIMEEFASRDGTDISDMEEKLEKIDRQLKEGSAKLVFDDESKTCNIVKVDFL